MCWPRPHLASTTQPSVAPWPPEKTQRRGSWGRSNRRNGRNYRKYGSWHRGAEEDLSPSPRGGGARGWGGRRVRSAALFAALPAQQATLAAGDCAGGNHLHPPPPGQAPGGGPGEQARAVSRRLLLLFLLLILLLLLLLLLPGKHTVIWHQANLYTSTMPVLNILTLIDCLIFLFGHLFLQISNFQFVFGISATTLAVFRFNAI